MQPSQGVSRDNDEDKLAFACPFYKSNPHKYHKCLKYTLNRIKDVKQHIYRQHTRPANYCARCYKLFASTKDRDEHSRRADCAKRHAPHFEGISDGQKDELKKSSSRTISPEEQWFEVWNVIFPGHQRPRSVWIGNHVAEMGALFRSLWNEKSAEIIANINDTMGGYNEVDSRLIAAIANSIFEQLEADSGSPSPTKDRGLPNNQDNMAFESTTQEESDVWLGLDAALEQSNSQIFAPIVNTDFDFGFGNACDLGFESIDVYTDG